MPLVIMSTRGMGKSALLANWLSRFCPLSDVFRCRGLGLGIGLGIGIRLEIGFGFGSRLESEGSVLGFEVLLGVAEGFGFGFG